MNAKVDRYREKPPLKIGGQPVLRMLDLGRQVQWTPGGVTPFTELAPSNVVIFELQGGHRAMLRPSGTEPKLKYYFYASAPAPAGVDFAESKKRALTTLERMVEDLIRSNDC
jgi:phosphomannomutase